jgi:hypothetical protein
LGWYKRGESYRKEREGKEDETKSFFKRKIGRTKGAYSRKPQTMF